jgi:hypothetical protein
VLCYDGVMTLHEVPPSITQHCCDVIENIIRVDGKGLRVELCKKPVLKHEWKDLTQFERSKVEVLKRVYSSYDQVKEHFELTSFKLRKPSAIATVTPPSDTDSSDVLMLYSPFKLKESTLNLFSYKITHIPARPTMTDENTRGEKLKRKRSRQPAEEASKDGELMVTSITSVQQSLFADKWLSDEDIRTYDCVDFMPRPLKCPPNVYNL